MTVNNGIPEGYAFSRAGTGELKSEGAIKNQKQQQALNDLYRSVPSSMIKGEPVLYGEDGLPDIDDTGIPQRLTPLEEQVMSASQRPVEPISSEVESNQFFGPSKRQQRPPQRPQQQQPQPPPQPPQPQQPPQRPKSQEQAGSTSYHPVIRKMLNVFGIKKNSRHDLEIYNEQTDDKLVYTMTLVNEELQSWALVEGKQRMTKDAGATYFELLFICCSVLAIDGVPVWKVFNISPTEDEVFLLDSDLLDMSFRLRKNAARALAELMWKDIIPFGDKMVEFYKEKVIGNKIQSSLDRETEDKVRYVCPLDGCENYDFFTPEFDNDGNELKFFCKFHGVALIKTIDLLKELDIPLA